jgi:hypothetical protein
MVGLASAPCAGCSRPRTPGGREHELGEAALVLNCAREEGAKLSPYRWLSTIWPGSCPMMVPGATVGGMRPTLNDDDPQPLLARTALLAAGYSSNEIAQARASGWMSNVRRGVYSPAEHLASLPAVGRHVLRARAEAWAAPSLVVSHVSAAAMHGLPVSINALSRVHLTRPGRSGAVRGSSRILHVASVDPLDIVEIGGVRTTSVARTLVDVARTESFEVAVTVADAALHAASTPGTTSTAPLLIGHVVELLEAIRGRVGATAARRSLDFADGRSESPGETRLRIAIAAIGLHAPHLQCKVHDPFDKFLGRTDFGFLTHGLLVEFDGMVKYSKLLREGQSVAEAVIEERNREKRLQELGWHVLRVIWSELFDLKELERRIRSMMDRGAKALTALGILGSATP